MRSVSKFRDAVFASVAALTLSHAPAEVRAQGKEVEAPEKTVEINSSCRGAIDALMRLGFPQNEAIAMAKKMQLYRPNEKRESSILQFGTEFMLFQNGTVEVTNQKGNRIARIPKDGPVDEFTKEEGGWLDSTLCRKDEFCPPGAALTPIPSKEVAPVAPVRAKAPEAVTPDAVTGPRIQVVLIAPCITKDPCGPKAVYSPLAIFDDVKQAKQFMKRAGETDPEFFESYYQSNLKGDERFVMIKDGWCFQIMYDPRAKEVVMSPHGFQIRGRDVKTRKRATLHGEENVKNFLQGDRSLQAIARDMAEQELHTDEVLEPIDPMIIYLTTEEGKVALERASSIAKRTVWSAWFEQAGVSREEFALLIDVTLPSSFFTTATASERVATVLERGESLGLFVNPAAAENMISVIMDEIETVPAPETMTVRKLLEHAALEKAKRVQARVVSP